MRVLFDQSAPYDLARYLEGHSVATAEECGWDRLTNGDLLATAEKDGFDLFLTRQKHHLKADRIVVIRRCQKARFPLL